MWRSGLVFSCTMKVIESHTTFQIEVKKRLESQNFAPNRLYNPSVAFVCTFIASQMSALTVSNDTNSIFPVVDGTCVARNFLRRGRKHIIFRGILHQHSVNYMSAVTVCSLIMCENNAKILSFSWPYGELATIPPLPLVSKQDKYCFGKIGIILKEWY